MRRIIGLARARAHLTQMATSLAEPPSLAPPWWEWTGMIGDTYTSAPMLAPPNCGAAVIVRRNAAPQGVR